MKKTTVVRRPLTGKFEVASSGPIPRPILESVIASLERMLNQRPVRLMRRMFGRLISLKGCFAATVKTNFRRSRRLHGIVFSVVVHLNENIRRVGHAMTHILNDVVEATIVLKPLFTGQPVRN